MNDESGPGWVSVICNCSKLGCFAPGISASSIRKSALRVGPIRGSGFD